MHQHQGYTTPVPISGNMESFRITYLHHNRDMPLGAWWNAIFMITACYINKKKPLPLSNHTSFHLRRKVKPGPASAMVARETSNLEAAGSSPALGSSNECSMRSTIFCDFFWNFPDFLKHSAKIHTFTTSHKYTHGSSEPPDCHSHNATNSLSPK
jgi:hypothetical protein